MKPVKTPTSAITQRADYTPPNYWVDTVEMAFDLHPTKTHVATRSTVRHRKGAARTLVWYGDTSHGAMALNFIAINGQRLNKGQYRIKDDVLTIANVPAKAVVDISTTLNPTANTTLMGLYASQGGLFTQCEAQGFRRMTFFADRPDVMSRYTVMLRADKAQYPVLLSNGNLLQSGDLLELDGTNAGRHFALWEDPFLKPSYLFAIVAADLAVNQTTIRNPHVASGQSTLQIYTRPQDLDATQWALDSLKASIAWDQKTFARPLDLERYMVVAVGNFNMGAMENKGLNIFNTAYVLAQPETATDTDYANIEAVIGHEYFHNWTGNRITCRDWFQLTLKEGLTVYRDQSFSADMAAKGLSKASADSARAVRRIEDVIALRAAQFGEDAGPMAHPVRPESYEDISNFYTATVYEKGAEVIRMQAVLANAARKDGFRAGMDTYFARHDGQAVTCDAFVKAISDGSGADLNQFKRWYEQAGTPCVNASGHYDAARKTYTLTLTQHNPSVGIEASTAKKLPLHIPVRVGLLDTQGKAIKPRFNGQLAYDHVLHLKAAKQQFVFQGIGSEPVPSLLRGFTAPVKLAFDYTDEQLGLLAAYDSDAFNRWDATQRLYQRAILAAYDAQSGDLTSKALQLAAQAGLNHALNVALQDTQLDNAFKATLLIAPAYNTLADTVGTHLAPQTLFQARETVLNELALSINGRTQHGWRQMYQHLTHIITLHPQYKPDAIQTGQRSLRNAVLALWLRTADTAAVEAARAQYGKAQNMTDRLGALSSLMHTHRDACQSLLADFYQRFANNDLVIDKWFVLQATQTHASVDDMQALIAHPAFSWTTPNRMRSVVFRFCMGNPVAFHAPDGQGYGFWLRCLEKLIAVNPDVAARLARAMDHWARHEPKLSSAMHQVMQRAIQLPNMPSGVREILHKSLSRKAS